MSNKATVRPGAARILVVDDSLVIRKAIEKKLQHEFDLVMASDGEAGWDSLQQNEVRVLVTDIEMPRLDGCALISRIRASADPRIRNIPIIAMTGAEDEETKERVLASGATDFLVKPIDPMQLLTRVHSLCRLDLTTRQLAESQAALKDQSTLDPLTGLSSRRYFQQSCQQSLAYAVRHGQGLALIRLEIDGFKSLYQQHGDDRVDQILVWLAGIFSATCRREDTVARIGGAEFAVLAPATNQEKAQALCRRLRQAVAGKPFVSGTSEISVTLNVGAATLEEADADTYDELMQLAERRLRNARNVSGDQTVAALEIDSESIATLPPDTQGADLVAIALPDESVPALPEVAEVAQLSGLEFDRSLFSQGATLPDAEAFAPEAGQNDVADSPEFVGLDAVLQRLADGEGDSIEPWLDSIAQRLLPLLEFYSERRAGVLAAGIAGIKARSLDQV